MDVYDLLEQTEEETTNCISEKITNTISNGNFANIFVEAFNEVQNQEEQNYMILLTGEYSFKFATKLKKAIIPVIVSAFHTPTDDIKAVYALDFYLSGIISIMNEWQENNQELSMEEPSSLVRTLLTEWVLKALGQAEQVAILDTGMNSCKLRCILKCWM